MRAKWLAVPAALALSAGLAACGDDNNDSSGSSGGASTNGAAAGDTGGSGGGGSTDQPGKGKPAVTLGDKNFTEQFILGELYAQALRAKGFTVNVKRNIGSSELTDKALTSKRIDMYPEYMGVVVTELARISDRPKSAQETYTKAAAFEKKRGYTVLKQTPFFNADAMVTTPAYAKKNGLTKISDLKKVGSFTFAAPPENRTRFQGVKGLKDVYKLSSLKFKPLAIGLQYPALTQGKVDTVTGFTTDAALVDTKKFTVLKDDQAIFGFQNIAPVVNSKVLQQQGPAFQETLNKVSALLTNKAMQQMNGAVDTEKKKPADVAKAFLQANNLL